MPFENEFASYEPLRRIVDSEEVRAMEARFKIRDVSEESEKNLAKDLIDKNKLELRVWGLMIIGAFPNEPLNVEILPLNASDLFKLYFVKKSLFFSSIIILNFNKNNIYTLFKNILFDIKI